MEFQNRVLLAGMVTGVESNMLWMSTTEVAQNRREYTQAHEITGTKKMFKDIKAGERVKMFGKFGTKIETRTDGSEFPKTIIIADRIEPHSDAKDINVGRLQGLAHRSFEFYNYTEGSGAYGNALVAIEDEVFSATAFRNTAHWLNRDFLEGSEVKLQGRVRTRPPYTDRNGDIQEQVEIVVDIRKSKVLKKAPDYDPLDEFDQADEKQASAGI